MQTAYPAAADVSALITAQGGTAPSNLAAIVAGVIGEWERRTGYKPFLGATTATTRAYDPPYKEKDFILDLDGGFWTVTSVYIGVTTTYAGTLLVLDDDYVLLPQHDATFDPDNDADDHNRGWDKIQFLSHPGFGSKSITVTGKRGYGGLLPDDVYQVIFDECVSRGSTAGSVGTGQEKRIKQGGFEIETDPNGGKQSKAVQASKAFNAAILSYMRL